MLLRKKNEAVGIYYTSYDESTGKVEGHVTQLQHGDLAEMVNKVLLVGGTTQIPLIRKRLTHLWGKEKFIQDDVVPPIEACSRGAAWKEEAGVYIVDRIPKSIVLDWNSCKHTLYQAYTPVVKYRLHTTTPAIECFRGECTVTETCEKATVLYETSDGEQKTAMVLSQPPPGKYSLEVDMFNRCMLNTPALNLQLPDGGFQHPIQIEQKKQLEQKGELQRLQELERARRFISKLPGEDHDPG